MIQHATSACISCQSSVRTPRQTTPVAHFVFDAVASGSDISFEVQDPEPASESWDISSLNCSLQSSESLQEYKIQCYTKSSVFPTDIAPASMYTSRAFSVSLRRFSGRRYRYGASICFLRACLVDKASCTFRVRSCENGQQQASSGHFHAEGPDVSRSKRCHET